MLDNPAHYFLDAKMEDPDGNQHGRLEGQHIVSVFILSRNFFSILSRNSYSVERKKLCRKWNNFVVLKSMLFRSIKVLIHCRMTWTIIREIYLDQIFLPLENPNGSPSINELNFWRIFRMQSLSLKFWLVYVNFWGIFRMQSLCLTFWLVYINFWGIFRMQSLCLMFWLVYIKISHVNN